MAMPDEIMYEMHDDPRWDSLMDNVGMSREILDAIEFVINLPK